MGYKLASRRVVRFAARPGRAKWGAVCALLACLAVASPLAADEALLKDGRRVPGELTLGDNGRLRFTPAGRVAPLPPADLAAVRFADAAPPPFRAASGFRVRLQDGQMLTGQLVGLNKEALRLRTAWAGEVELPRAAVAALTHLPGWRTLVEDDFADGLKAWTSAGKPEVEGGDKGPRRVILNNPGQSLTFKPSVAVEAGGVGVLFEEVGTAAGARWLLEMQFAGKCDPVPLRVTLAGSGEGYEVEVPGIEGESRRVARSPGPHLLRVQFKPTSLRVTCDDDVLWYNLDRGPGGALHQVVLRCQESARPAELRGSVAFAAFTLARAVDEPPRPPGDPTQDELWLATDDQLFGRIVRADRRAVEIEGRYGTRAFAWAEVRGCFLKREKPLPRPDGEAAVRLELRPGLGAEPDVLEGVLTGLDAKKLTLRHALLGERAIERSRVKELRPLGPKE
jgi:hypothetical protein